MSDRERTLPALRSTAIVVAIALYVVAAAGKDARAQWRDEHSVFRVGFIATVGAAYDTRRLEPFRRYLESWLPMAVELVPMTTYAALIDAQVNDRVQYAIHTASSFAAAFAACHCVEPVAVPAAYNGATGFFAVLITRTDSGIADVTGAQGRRLAVSSDDSVAGRLIPLQFLAHDDIGPDSYFSAVVEAEGPYAAVSALMSGTADVAAAWSSLTGDAALGYDFGVLTDVIRDGVVAPGQLRVIWQSPLIPFGPHAVRSDVPPEIRQQIDGSLAAMAVDDPAALDAVDRASFGGGGFVPITTDDYAPVAELIGGFGDASVRESD